MRLCCYKAQTKNTFSHLQLEYHRMTRKGIRLIFLNQDGEIIVGLCFGMVQLILAVTQTSASTLSAEWGRVVFSF